MEVSKDRGKFENGRIFGTMSRQKVSLTKITTGK
jgi:hypothetical protein